MFIFFIVVWIIAIYCIFRNIMIEKNDEVKNIEKNYDPVDDPESIDKKPELSLREIINNQVLDDEFNKVDSAEGSIIGIAYNSENKKND
jgi:hypothetical protein